MSLILEALRKSEAERRRGEAPGLHVELPPGLEARMRSRWRPPVRFVVAAALLGVAAGVFWHDAPMAPDGADAGSAVRTIAMPSDRAPAPSLAGPRTDAEPPRERYEAGLPKVERILPPPPVPPVEAEAAPDTTRTAAVAAPAAAGADPGASAAAPRPTRTSSPPGASPAARPATPAARSSGPVLRVSGLTGAQRERLPPLKLSMHMWDEDPARRFAVVDGQRRVEGDRLGDAVITAIDREGVLLELDGQAVRIPLP